MNNNVITIVNPTDLNSLGKRFILFQTEKKGKVGCYKLKVLDKEVWEKETDGIKDLGKIIKIVDNAILKGGDFSTAIQLVSRLSHVAKKHNTSKIRWLSFFIIPKIVAKIFGWKIFGLYKENITIQTPKLPEALSEEQNLHKIKELLPQEVKQQLERKSTQELKQALAELEEVKVLVSANPEKLTCLDFSIFKNVKFLTIDYNRGHLPKGLGQLQNLEKLHLLQADLKSLPEEIGHLKKLKVLELDHCKMETIPEVVYQLSSLEELSMHGLVDALSMGEAGHEVELDLNEQTCNKLKELTNLRKLTITYCGWPITESDSKIIELKKRLKKESGPQIELVYR